jgi:hypothetical protein
MLENILPKLLYLGGVLALSGVVSLTILQFRLIGRLERSFFSIFSVIFFPDYELSALERIGGILLLTGGLFVFIPFLLKYAF